MRRAGALPRHVWRTVIYSGDVLALAGLLMLPLAVAVPLSEDFGGYMSIGFQLLAITAYLLLLQRLAVACRLYLRIHQAALVVAATQVIFLLCVCLLCVVTYRW